MSMSMSMSVSISIFYFFLFLFLFLFLFYFFIYIYIFYFIFILFIYLFILFFLGGVNSPETLALYSTQLWCIYTKFSPSWFLYDSLHVYVSRTAHQRIDRRLKESQIPFGTTRPSRGNTYLPIHIVHRRLQ